MHLWPALRHKDTNDDEIVVAFRFMRLKDEDRNPLENCSRLWEFGMIRRNGSEVRISDRALRLHTKV